MSSRYAVAPLFLVLLTNPGNSAPIPAAKAPPVRSEVHVVSINEGAKDPAGGGVRLAAVMVDRAARIPGASAPGYYRTPLRGEDAGRQKGLAVHSDTMSE
jgi:hypothetical protein